MVKKAFIILSKKAWEKSLGRCVLINIFTVAVAVVNHQELSFLCKRGYKCRTFAITLFSFKIRTTLHYITLLIALISLWTASFSLYLKTAFLFIYFFSLSLSLSVAWQCTAGFLSQKDRKGMNKQKPKFNKSWEWKGWMEGRVPKVAQNLKWVSFSSHFLALSSLSLSLSELVWLGFEWVFSILKSMFFV